MTTQTRLGVVVSLQAGCDYDVCADFAFPLYNQLKRGYETCAVLPMPESVEAWRREHRTARRRANRATNLGYLFHEIRREQYGHDIFLINTSLEERQGRPMSRGYREEQTFLPLPDYPCPLHAIRTYGVVSDRGTLVAYLWLYRSGELALVSSILGHGEHLANDVMYLLFQGVVGAEIPHGGYFVYNRADSGTDGLRYFKDKLGFLPMEVAWAP
jgi:hypothetical protein